VIRLPLRVGSVLLGSALVALPALAGPSPEAVSAVPAGQATAGALAYSVGGDVPLGLTAARTSVQPTRLRGSVREYKFIASRGGKPARWNPCTVIRYRIRTGGMSATDVKEVRAAFARVGAASGLRFSYAGTTSYVWSKHRRNGTAPRDAALTFAFADAGSRRGQSDLLGSSRVVGIGGPAWRDNGSAMRIVAGNVVINRKVITRLPRGTGKGVRMNAYLHEIGHAVGLDHTTGRSELMYPTLQLSLPPVFGAGDLAGLRRLGRSAGCLPRP
jgi:hypothetical protein